MAQYPIEVPRKGYAGSDPRMRKEAQEHNRVAGILQKHINEPCGG